MALRLEGLQKTYGAIRAVDGVTLELPPGRTLALLGPSGCGKSTLLRLIAGLDEPDAGRLLDDDHDITPLPPQRRGFGMVFQDYALFPHLNVEQNIAFGLVESGWSKAQRRARVMELLELVGLPGTEKRRTFELSGGQQQRVALARALAPRPPLLLLDEPLSNLDMTLRAELKEQLRRLLNGLDTTAVYVTHDQDEAFTIAETVAVMRAGRLIQRAAPEALYARPACAWVARFLGHDNVYRLAEHPGLAPLQRDGRPYLLLRSDLIRLHGGMLPAEVRRHRQSGGLHHLDLWLPAYGVSVGWLGYSRELPAGLAPGQTLELALPDEAVVGLDDAT